MLPLLHLARLHHWIKNVFILMPLPFAYRTEGTEFQAGTLAAGILGFSIVTSAVYVFNDILDAERDGSHPIKCRRPIPAGQVTPLRAAILSLLLLLAGLSLVAWTGRGAAFFLTSLYVAVNVVYCLGGKHVALIDVFILSSGYVLRVLLGCALVAAAPSNWLLLCGMSLALFLALTKRHADLAAGVAREHRPSLSGYHLGFLDQAITISASITLLSYALYCMSDASHFRAGREFFSLPFAAFGIFDYLRLIRMKERGQSPVGILLSSPTLGLCGLAWALVVAWSLDFF